MKSKKKIIIVYTDGGSRGNPGNAGAGAIVMDGNNNVLKTASKSLGVMTNNEAEYEAVILALDILKRLLGKKKLQEFNIQIKMDSELLEKQLNGEYQIKEERLFPYFIKIWNAQVKDFPKITFTHVPREQNKVADQLANDAMDEGGARQLF